MPSRTYTGIDLINYATDNQLGSQGTGSNIPSFPSNGSCIIAGSVTDPVTCELSGYVELSGDFDFDAFPAIPDNALITKVTFRISGSVVVAALATSDTDIVNALGAAGIGVSLTQITIPPGTLLANIFIGDVQNNSASNSASISINESDNYTNFEEFDFSGSPIDKAALQAQFGSIFIYLGGVEIAGFISNVFGGASSAGTNPSTSATAGITVNNFQMLVEYQSGPDITLSPSGGDVEPGQSITVTGDNVNILAYAALFGNQVIPIIPKIIGPDEVVLEVPSPDADCADCFDDCPECEDCFDVCNEDLTGDACQACMQACLDCLVECLDDLEAGEDCQASADSPPDDEIPIVIICGGPGFTGSVPLGNFTILVARASGIYQLLDGKDSDTLYATARDGTTYDVKIPNPNAKTGFFRS